MPRQQDASVFARVAVELHADRDVTTTARAIVSRLVDLVDGADGAALSVHTTDGHDALAATDDATAARDAVLWTTEGSAPRRVLAGDAEVALQELPDGGEVVAAALPAEGRVAGVVTLHARQQGALADPEVQETVRVYAAHAATALEAARHVSGLGVALGSRHTIGMAQGILIERFDLDPERSFALLRRLSSTHEMKLRDVAAHLVATGSLPDVRNVADGFDGDTAGV